MGKDKANAPGYTPLPLPGQVEIKFLETTNLPTKNPEEPSKRTNGTLAVADTYAQVTHRYVPISLLTVGILLIVASWTSLGKMATDAAWAPEDAAVYGRLVEENHSMSYQSVERSGLTEEEFAAKRKNLEDKLGAMIDRLEYAKSQPEVWSRNLFWAGTVLAVLGALSHLFGRARTFSK